MSERVVGSDGPWASGAGARLVVDRAGFPAQVLNERSYPPDQETMPRKRRGTATRSDIIRAAHSLFIQHGYHGTSMRQIASEAGAALGGIYNHFAGKDNLFATVLFEYHPIREVLPALEQADGKSLEDFLRDAAARMQEALGHRPGFLKLKLSSSMADTCLSSSKPSIPRPAPCCPDSWRRKVPCGRSHCPYFSGPSWGYCSLTSSVSCS